MIVDCHCHAGEGDGFTGPWDTSAPLERYLRRARAAGIDRTVVFPAFHSDYAIANRGLAALVRRHAPRLLGFAFLHAERDRGRVSNMVDDAVDKFGFVGLKIHHHDAPISREICVAAARRRLPILYDVAGNTHVADLVAGEFPTVPFVFPHLGSFADDWRAQRAMIDVVARHANAFTDSSGVRRFDLLVELVERAGAAKLLFGTDGPWLHPAVELSKIDALGLTPSARARVLGRNLLGLLRSTKELRRSATPAR